VSNELALAYKLCHFWPVGNAPWIVLPMPFLKSIMPPLFSQKYGLELSAIDPVSFNVPFELNVYRNGELTGRAVVASTFGVLNNALRSDPKVPSTAVLKLNDKKRTAITAVADPIFAYFDNRARTTELYFSFIMPAV
jgi:hypothetical protein